jgi:hypothetical protein
VNDANSNTVVLDNIPFTINGEKVLKQLQLHGDKQRFEKTIRELMDLVIPIARPKAVYKVSHIGKNNGESLEIDGITFTGRFPKENLDKAGRVFPYVSTCGREIDAIETPPRDMLRRYCLEAIRMAIVIDASMYLKNHLTKQYSLGDLSNMSPGHNTEWPITQQKELFSLMGDVESMIGVKLTEGYTMMPIKSRSGIHF